jgi:hypothetical protein
MAEEYVQDFDGEKVDEKTILERKVMEGKELSVDDRLIIIRALEKAGDSVFNSNQGLTIGSGYSGWWDPTKITYNRGLPLQPQITCNNNAAPDTTITVYSNSDNDASGD